MSRAGTAQTRQLIYENRLSAAEDIRDFRMEGQAAFSFPLGRLRMENATDPKEGQKSNFVLWCPETFPADVSIEWDFWPIREPGLCILFFSARGRQGEDLFDPALAPRTGEYDLYHHGDIDALHISYFRRRYPEERAFHLCNLRKSYGFHMVAQGADPIPPAADAVGPYRMRVDKLGGKVSFYTNELLIFEWEDDGTSFGPVLGGGKLGFRQMAPLMAEYANLKVYALE
ncbi:DUF1961 family protein [Paenibacillus rigui]|uniref:DUF1961 domain-containing protein n=1 Tax=Paenibacillus rigui TaxID=554312 RepID=A0A229UWA8_9BACL|nr:DUF1961 family protein [Paenibacillus rigui]OXM87425.1 hypothetical protein CF651_04790 [Paenibacillus rigui]